jgi:predicted nucleic acid-binding protein
MRSRLFLDSTFVIDHLRGDPAAIARWWRVFEDGETPFIGEVTVCEVRAGLRTSDEPQLATFIEPIEFVQPGPVHAMTAGRWRADARARGWTLSLPDALIAACADSLDAAVLTRNGRDFALTPVRVETY